MHRKPGVWIGAGSAVVVIAAAVVAFLFYQPKFVATALEVPEAVVSGDDVTVTVLLGNTGWGAGERELTILVDEAPGRTTDVRLAGGAEEQIEIVVPDLLPGNHKVSLVDFEELTGVVWVMTPPEFVIDSVAIEPNPLDIITGNQAVVVVQVSNTGEAEGAHDFQLALDGQAGESRSITLAGGATTEERFTITVDGPGPREVTVGDTTTILRVLQLERPGNGTLFVNDIGGGSNELRITNNSPQDVVVVLAAPGVGQPALLSVYVQATSSSTVTGVRDGVYSTYFVFGSAWCTYSRAFTQGATHSRFEQDAVFESGPDFYTSGTMELGGTEGTGVPTLDVPPADFPTM